MLDFLAITSAILSMIIYSVISMKYKWLKHFWMVKGKIVFHIVWE